MVLRHTFELGQIILGYDRWEEVMTTTFAGIINWVKELEFWEQAAFDLIVSGKEISEEDINSLVRYLLEENNLLEKEREHPQLKFNDYQVAEKDNVPYRLRKISNLRNINALVAGQTLEFGPNLTTIFGANASGKSGYARVLGSAGFTRGDQEIIPDITKVFDPDAPQLVDIELESDGELVSIEHKVGTPCPQLSLFYIFDSTSVIVHLTKKNTISFSPAGLSYLHKLVDLTDKVREKLTQQIDEKRKPNIYESLFQGDSEIKNIISSINHETDIASLKSLADLSPEDDAILKKLKQRVATIETQGISKKLEELEQNKIDLSGLISQVQEANKMLSEEAIEVISRDIKNFNSHITAANLLGLEKFKSGKLQSVGSDEWLDFIESAKSLSVVEAGDNEPPYPQE